MGLIPLDAVDRAPGFQAAGAGDCDKDNPPLISATGGSNLGTPQRRG